MSRTTRQAVSTALFFYVTPVHAVRLCCIEAVGLAGEEATDITKQVDRTGEWTILDGGLIGKMGLSSAAPGDRFEPQPSLKFI